MEVSRLYLDSNILISLGEGTDEVAHLLTELVLQQEPSETPFLCTSELTLSEILVQPYRVKDDELIDKYNGWLISGTFMEVGPLHRSVLWYAAVVRANNKAIKLPDAIHVAAAIGFSCSHMLTADRGIEDIDLVHERYGQTKTARLEILRPDPQTLRAIIQSQRNA